jgi:uncharacterized protein with gpF-like domain
MNRRWIIFARKTKTLEDRYIPTIRQIIRDFRSQFITDLKTNGLSAARSNLSQQMISERMSRTLQSIYRTAGLMGAKMQQAEFAAYLKEPEKKAGSFGRNEAWIREVLNYLRFHSLSLVSNITDTMREDILKILEKGIEEQLSIDDIVTLLRKSNLIAARAKVIARTEIIRAANVGHAVSAAQSPYEVKKEWSAARDHRTRHSHQLINGNTIEEDDLFRVAIYKGDKPTGTFDMMTFPGDPTASASNTVNCRCRALYIPQRDANGRLIMRNQNTARVIPMKPVQSYTPAQIAAQLKASIKIGV